MSQGLSVANDDAITPTVIYEEGAGKAYQSVAQSTALAIQDATDTLRNINTISATAIGVAIAQMLESPATAVQYGAVLNQIFTVNAKAAENFTTIGTDAVKVLKEYPYG
jgi:hypothetical protein